MGKIRVLLAEDHTIVRKGLRALLDDETDIEVVGEAEDGRETVRQVERVHPDVVLMDITMPLLNGVEATRQIKAQHPEVQVLGLTRHENEEYIYQLLRAGASGYVSSKQHRRNWLRRSAPFLRARRTLVPRSTRAWSRSTSARPRRWSRAVRMSG